MRFPASLLSPLVVLFFLGSMWIGTAWELPSMRRAYAEAAGEVGSADFIVRGLRCRGTSNFFMSMMEGAPGVVSVTTFVQEHRAEIEYDPSRTDPDRLAAAIGRSVRLRDGRVIRPFQVVEIKR
jgi:hypothetical protein